MSAPSTEWVVQVHAEGGAQPLVVSSSRAEAEAIASELRAMGWSASSEQRPG